MNAATHKGKLISRLSSVAFVLIRELGVTIAILIFATLVVFTLISLAPSPEYGAHPSEQIDLKKEKAIPTRYVLWVSHLLQSGLGTARSGRPVLMETKSPFFVTLKLSSLGVFFTLLFAIPIAVLSAGNRYPIWASLVSNFSYISSAVPVYLLGYAVILASSGKIYYSEASGFKSFIIPALLLGIGNGALGEISRQIRQEVAKVLSTPYIRAARARGVSVFKHGGRNCIIPIVSIVNSRFTLLLGGTVVTETVFRFPGLGKKAWDAASYSDGTGRDYAVIMAVTLILVFLVRLINLFSNLIYSWFSPTSE